MTVRATWNGTVLAEGDDSVVVEGNHYLPPQDVRDEYFEAGGTQTACPWKGAASYRSVVGGARNDDSAWYCPDPKDAAEESAHWVAFWEGVTVEQVA
jgi:uncharacterized protein (DUF427 family)